MKPTHIAFFLAVSLVLLGNNTPSPVIAVASGDITTRVTETFLHSTVEIILTNLEAANYSIEANGCNLTSWENPALQTSKTIFLSFDDRHVSNNQIAVELVDNDADSTIGTAYLSVFSPDKFIFPDEVIDMIPPILVFAIAILLFGLILKKLR